MPLLDERLTVSRAVALRPEPFGALAYHFGNRRLTFLKRPDLVAVVRGLMGDRTVRQVLVDCRVPESQWEAYAVALQNLVDADMLTVGDQEATP